MTTPDFQFRVRPLLNVIKDGVLIVKHGLGVSTKETYQVKAIDSDYFTED